MWAGRVIMTALMATATAKNSLAFSPSGKMNRRMDVPSTMSPSSSSRNFPPSSSLKLSAVYADEAVDSLTDDDSIRVAYDKWRAKYNKGPFDEIRFENFKRNYVALMRANTTALRKANELGMRLPSLMSLNEYADYSVDEYKAMRKGGQAPPKDTSENQGAQQLSVSEADSPTSNGFQTADYNAFPTQESNGFQAGESNGFQAQESNRFESYDNVSSTRDETEPDRVRKAYLDWCKEFGKTVEEERYEVFRSHFLAIEKHCLETGKEMKLNAWADFTPQEFVRAQGVTQSTATPKRSNKLSDPDFLRSRTKDVITTEFSTESKSEAGPTSGSSEGASMGDIGSSYLDSMSSSNIANDTPGTQSNVHSQENSQQPSFLDSLNGFVGEKPSNPPTPSSDSSSETERNTSARSESEGFDYASYADSLSKSSSSKDEDTSQRSYLDAIAMQQNPTSPPPPQETSLTRDLDEQAQDWESFNQGGSDGVTGSYPQSYDGARAKPKDQTVTFPDQPSATETSSSFVQPSNEVVADEATRTSIPLSDETTESNDSGEGIDVYLRRKEEAKKAVQEALARRQELEMKRVKLEKEAAEAERRVREQDEKTAQEESGNGQKWDSLKALFNLETKDLSQDSTGGFFGSAKGDAKSVNLEVPSFGFGDWFGNKNKNDNEAVEMKIEDPTPTKKSSSMFDIFGSVDKSPPKDFQNTQPNELEKAKPTKSMFDFFGSVDKSPPIEDEKIPPKELEKAKTTSSMFDLFGSTDKSPKKELEKTPPAKEVERPKPENDWWKSIVFDFFGARDDDDIYESIKKVPGRGTFRLADQGYPKKSVFDLFIDTTSLWARNEPGRGTIRIEKNPKPGIFSFFANNKALRQSPLFSIFDSKPDSQKLPKKGSKKGKSNSLFSKAEKKKREDAIAARRKTQAAKVGKINKAREQALQEKRTNKPTFAIGRGTFSINKPTTQDTSPSLSMWTQNDNGSITGFISNSQKYRDGTKVTTSPAPFGAKPGSVIETYSGSAYKLGLNIDQPTGGPSSYFPWSIENQVKDDIPVLRNWNQNPDDDTLSGSVKNSKEFIDGAIITTSPVQKGVKQGDVVRTRGGSLYRLE